MFAVIKNVYHYSFSDADETPAVIQSLSGYPGLLIGDIRSCAVLSLERMEQFSVVFGDSLVLFEPT